MKKLLSLAAIVVLFGAGCSLFQSGSSGMGYVGGPKVPPSAIPPKPARTFEDESKSIRVTNMTEGQLLTNGFIVEGQGVAFESSISWRAEDSEGNTLGNGHTMIAQPDTGVAGPFRIQAFFDRLPASTSGTLFVFENSAKDGSEIHVVKVPVTLSTDTQTVSVYFGSSVQNPNAADCALVYPLTRTVAAGRMPYIAVHELLKGPTVPEKAAGYYTSIPDGVTLQDPVDADGFAVLDFNVALLQGVAGSCKVTAIRAQIETTAKQDGGDLLPITVYGRDDEVLQP